VRKADLQKFKKVFVQQREEILSNAKLLDEGFVIRDDVQDDADQATSGIELSMRTQMKRREVVMLRRIDDALKRLGEGTFGQCLRCEENIELRRLQARPTTSLCILCQEEAEKESATSSLGRMGENLLN
jgi:DnaK suppressor protein